MLTLKLGKAKIPMLVTNHTYDSMSLYGGKQMSGGCLAAGTKIFTRGGYKNIEDITEDDFVYTKEGEFMKVLDTHNFKNKELLQIEFDDGYQVVCTPEHKFLVNDEWIEAKDLIVNENVSCT
jgi:intein/homing endonuclease